MYDGVRHYIDAEHSLHDSFTTNLSRGLHSHIFWELMRVFTYAMNEKKHSSERGVLI